MCEERSDELKEFLEERRYGMLFLLSLRSSRHLILRYVCPAAASLLAPPHPTQTYAHHVRRSEHNPPVNSAILGLERI